jgi:hypothetical protein
MASPIEPWLRFTWNLKSLPADPTPFPNSFNARAFEEHERGAIIDTVSRAFILDSEWTNTLKNRKDQFLASLECALDNESCPTLVLTHGTRIIGASVLSGDTTDVNHLVSGPCMLMEYRSRGLGKLMLEHSLRALRAAGLSLGRGLTKERSTAGRYVYKAFGGSFEKWDDEKLFNAITESSAGR